MRVSRHVHPAPAAALFAGFVGLVTVALAGCARGAAPKAAELPCDHRLPSGVCLAIFPAAGPAPKRDGAALVALVEGQALLLGGRNADGAVGTCDRFEAASLTWHACAPLPVPRDGIGAAVRYDVPGPTYLGEKEPDLDEKVLVLGGSSFRAATKPDGSRSYQGTPFLREAAVFDVERNSWGKVPASFGSFSGTATPIEGGRIVVTTYPVHEKPVVANRNGRLVTDVPTSLFLYSTLSGGWIPGAGTRRNHDGGGAAKLVDGRVLVAGPSDIDIYDPAANSWSEAGTSGLAGSERPTLAVLDRFRVLEVGGRVPGGFGVPHHDAEILDLRGTQHAVEGPPGETSSRFVAIAVPPSLATPSASAGGAQGGGRDGLGTVYTWSEERGEQGANAGTSLLGRFDARAERWEVIHLPIPVDTPMATLLDDGRLLFVDTGTRASFVVTASQ